MDKRYPAMNVEELKVLQKRFILGWDKWFRMCAGHASDILMYRKGIMHLEIRINGRFGFWNYGLDSLAIHMVDTWRNLPEFREARGYEVDLYFTGSPSGIALGTKGKNREQLQDSILRFVHSAESGKHFLGTVKGWIDQEKIARHGSYLSSEYCRQVPSHPWIYARPEGEDWLDFLWLCLKPLRLHYANDFMFFRNNKLLSFLDADEYCIDGSPGDISLLSVTDETHVLHARLPYRPERHILGLIRSDANERKQYDRARLDALKWALLQLRPIIWSAGNLHCKHWSSESNEEFIPWCTENKIFLP